MVEYTTTVDKGVYGTFKPPEAVKNASKRGLKLAGPLEDFATKSPSRTNLSIAQDLSKGKGLPIEGIRQMLSYFNRNESKMALPENCVPTDKGYPGKILKGWLMLGGNAGKSWATKILRYGNPKPKNVLKEESDTQLVFVVSEPNAVEKARGQLLIGLDGKFFQDRYLTCLDLPRSSVKVLDLSQADHIAEGNSTVIALGKAARNVLAEKADFSLPHPNAVRRFGDSGEVSRKMRAVLRTLAKLNLDGELQKDRYSEARDSNNVATSSSGLIEESESRLSVEDGSGQDLTSIEEGQSGTSQDLQSGSEISKSLIVPIVKANDEKKIVYGVVLDPYIVDAQKDWISPKSIEETAHKWMADSRVIGFDHKEKAQAQAVESWIVPYPSSEDYQKAVNGEEHKAYKMPYGSDVIHSGSWVLGTKLGDREWDLVKQGELNAYSIGGYGVRNPITSDQIPKVSFVELKEES